jgi:glutathione S-transferase
MLCYLELPFIDIFLEEFETQKPTLSERVKSILQLHPVKQAELPAIIHDGLIIYELNQIMTYLSRAFDNEDMLGRTIQQKVTNMKLRLKYVK